VRLLVLVAIAVVVLAVLLPLVRRPAVRAGRPPVPLTDELVKDPVCQTYVVRSRAVRGHGDGAPYFCSEECARRYAG
jgi:hypothetical protein